MKRVWVSFLCLGGLFLAVSGLVAQTAMEIKYSIGDTPGVIYAPAEWQSVGDLNDEADLQISSKKSGLFLIVLAESIEDLELDGLQDYATNRLVPLQEALDDLELNGPTPVLVNGLKGITYRLDAVLEHTRISYLMTFVQGESHYYQILTWGTRSAFRKGEALVRTMSSSFREVHAD